MSHQLNDLQHERYEANFNALVDCVFAGVNENSIAQLAASCKIDEGDRVALVKLMKYKEAA